ncbi:ABC transporter ATP-binding protein [Amaricoccus tamworthensis]|uniref:ABC transporter ATP-binding protein n=1 Tax=Amaricoccus tamworthensis TaxID=57002 RepID=UPI003C7DB6A0
MTEAPAVTVEGSARISGQPLFGPLRLEMAAGSWTCLLGPSGVGKSSLLRLVAGLGSGIDFVGTLAANDGEPLEGRISYMAQDDLLFPWLTVLENTQLGARLRRETPDPARAMNMLERVGLSDHASKRPAQLSGGQKQRVALARTLIEDRPIALLDEPFSALDARTRAEMQDLAARLLAGRTVLLVTHEPGEAARLGHKIVVMNETGLQSTSGPKSDPVRAITGAETLSLQSELHELLMARP